jgi:hypothetical protein
MYDRLASIEKTSSQIAPWNHKPDKISRYFAGPEEGFDK